jgi:PAS domain-containing protein
MSEAEREQHRTPLEQSEERFRLLVESVSYYAMFMLDPEGRVLTWNSGAEEIKGYTAAQIVGEHFSKFYPADAIRSGWPEHELSCRRAGGSI